MKINFLRKTVPSWKTGGILCLYLVLQLFSTVLYFRIVPSFAAKSVRVDTANACLRVLYGKIAQFLMQIVFEICGRLGVTFPFFRAVFFFHQSMQALKNNYFNVFQVAPMFGTWTFKIPPLSNSKSSLTPAVCLLFARLPYPRMEVFCFVSVMMEQCGDGIR